MSQYRCQVKIKIIEVFSQARQFYIYIEVHVSWLFSAVELVGNTKTRLKILQTDHK